MVTTFRILHASDFHIGATPWDPGNRFTRWIVERMGLQSQIQSWRPILAHDANVLRAFAVFAHDMRKKVDALIITGDLATTGYPTDLRAAHEFLTAPITYPPHLTATNQPTLVEWTRPKMRMERLPGNHDRYRPKLSCRPGGTLFDGFFSPDLWLSRMPIQSGISPILKGDVVLHVVKADFALRRGDHGRQFWLIPGWFGQGRVREEIVDELVAETNRVRNLIMRQNRTPVSLWAIHFDPFTTDGALQLLQSERLIRAAQDAGVRIILCGHTHESKIKPLSDTKTVFACGTTCQANSRKDECPARNDCQILQIEVDPGPVATFDPDIRIQVIWYRYDHTPQGQEFRRLSKGIAIT